MSRSPKYSTVNANEERKRRRAEERAVRERARRVAEEQRARAALEAGRGESTRQLAVLTEACNALGKQTGALISDTTPVLAAVNRARQLIASASDPSQLGLADHAIVEAELLRTSVSGEILRRGKQSGTGQVAALRNLLGVLNIRDRSKFDRGGSEDADRLLDQLSVLLAQDDLASFARTVKRAIAVVRAHHAAVTERAARHAEQLRIARATETELSTRVRALADTAEAARIPLADIATAADVLDVIRGDLRNDYPGEAIGLAERLSARLATVERDLDDAIERRTERREMLGAIVDALPGLGFAVDAASLQAGDDGSLAIRAHPRRGDPLVVVIDDDAGQQHRINYLREGADEDIALDGKTCGSLRDLAEQLNGSLRRNGFDAGAVRWDDDGDPPRRTAARRTAVEDGARRRGGVA